MIQCGMHRKKKQQWIYEMSRGTKKKHKTHNTPLPALML
jgi:hypothetical protein